MSKKQTKETLLEKCQEDANGCWLWQRCVQKDGYGTVHYHSKTYLAHRLFYELFEGPMPAGLEIDHLCRVRNCVNPKHLEPVDHQTNMDRGDYSANGPRIAAFHSSKTHCAQGHSYSGDNLQIHKNGKWRICVACKRKSRKKK